MRSKSPQTLSFRQPLPLSISGDFYVKLLIMSSTHKLNFLCDFTLLTKMGNKNNPEQRGIVVRAKKLLFRLQKQLFSRTSWCSE